MHTKRGSSIQDLSSASKIKGVSQDYWWKMGASFIFMNTGNPSKGNLGHFPS